MAAENRIRTAMRSSKTFTFSGPSKLHSLGPEASDSAGLVQIAASDQHGHNLADPRPDQHVLTRVFPLDFSHKGTHFQIVATITPSHSQLYSITAVRTAELAADSKRTLVRRRLPTLLLSEGRYGCQRFVYIPRSSMW